MKNFILGLITIITLNSMAYGGSPATHGMLLFGKNHQYASHLPMFHSPHDYQVILDIVLENGPAKELYDSEVQEGHSFFTLVPERMDLTKIISGEKTSFQALIYKDHFEQGGTNLGQVLVNIEKVIFSKKLDEDASFNENQQDYIIFGANGEYYAAHNIFGKPSFDAIYQVEQVRTLNANAPCGRGACPEPVLRALADNKLPIHLHYFQADQGALAPEDGDILEVDSLFELTTSKIINNLYLEISELSF